MGELKDLRIEKKMTQQQVADLVGVSLRSYKSYENDGAKKDTIKYKYIVEQLTKINYIDEEHGVLTIEDIARKCKKVFSLFTEKVITPGVTTIASSKAKRPR